MMRSTAVGFVVGAVVFGSLGVILNVRIGASPWSNLGPVAMLALIGGTTAALISPMLRRRRAAGHDRGDRASEEVGGESPDPGRGP